MALEVATYISQLDPNWPLGTDKQDRGDDHLRLIKDVLKKTLAGPNGTGWEKAVTVSPDQLNGFNQRITDLENGLKNVYKVGDIMIRADNVNPQTMFPGTTWTRLDGDFTLHLGNGTNGGTTTGNSFPAVPLPNHSHGASLNISSAGGHSHTVGLRVRADFIQSGWNYATGSNGNSAAEHHSTNPYMPLTDYTGAHVHGGSVSIGNAGVDGASIDVRGARIFLNIWKRVT